MHKISAQKVECCELVIKSGKKQFILKSIRLKFLLTQYRYWDGTKSSGFNA